MNRNDIDVKELRKLVETFGFSDKTKSLKTFMESEWHSMHYLLLTITTRTKIPVKDRLAMTCYLYNKKLNGGVPSGADEYDLLVPGNESRDWLADVFLKPRMIEEWHKRIRSSTMERWRKAGEAVISVNGTWSRKYVRRLRKEFPE